MWKRVPEYLKENILLLPNYLFLIDSIWMCFANFIKVSEMEKEKGSKKKERAITAEPAKASPGAAHQRPRHQPSKQPQPVTLSLSLPVGTHLPVPTMT